jgi:hypothetical protein
LETIDDIVGPETKPKAKSSDILKDLEKNSSDSGEDISDHGDESDASISDAQLN